MQISGLDYKIQEMAGRIKELREIIKFTPAEMADKTGVTIDEYLACERGEKDLNFAFIYRCAMALGVDVTDIIEGVSPTLSSYTLTRKGEGQRIDEAHGMTYYNLAPAFQNRVAEPLFVQVPYDPLAENSDIELTSHEGQELDIVITGKLMVQVGSHKEVLNEGDTIYYDSSTPHGMIAVGGNDCCFYAIVLDQSGAPDQSYLHSSKIIEGKKRTPADRREDEKDRIYNKFIECEEDENGTPTKITFKNTEHFNFAFDILDEIAKKDPNKLALLHIAKDKTERRFTFDDIKRLSNRCANYYKAIGIKRGDKVMLVLRRNYQYWFAIMGLNKIGAVAILAPNQLQEHDFEYRFNAAGVKAILCTADGNVAEEAEKAIEKCPSVEIKIIVNGKREGWRTFDEEYPLYRSYYRRTETSPGGDDLMLMFFTSGTSGYPKMAAHNYKYALGHFHTAHYWHCVDPDGLHFTISDTGWAKAMWGKLYGQWLCEAGLFIYDFDRFDAADILPMFAKYNITTFCAPPTMLRMLIKQDLSHYDLSSVQHMTTAGEALNPEVYRQFEKATGLQIMEGFGQTETTMVIGNMIGAPHKVGSMGKPAPIYEIELLDDSGKPVPVGENGEICIHVDKGAPNGLFREYYNAPDKTAEAWHDGFYHTGDIAWKDEDGFYWFVGRVDDVIKSSGYRIGPFEIESVIMELPYVLECGVSAAPDPVRGQIVKASVVLTPGTEGTEELKKEIQNYVKANTAPYKYPRLVVFKDELPKTVSGKIQRNKL